MLFTPPNELRHNERRSLGDLSLDSKERYINRPTNWIVLRVLAYPAGDFLTFCHFYYPAHWNTRDTVEKYWRTFHPTTIYLYYDEVLRRI